MLSGPKLSEFDSFIKSISPQDKIALLHDLDADGISSGAIAYNAVKLLRGKTPDLVITQPFKTTEILPKSIALLKKKKINKLIVVDSALDQSPDCVSKAEKIVQGILVIDHHKDYGSAKFKKTIVIKPQLVSDVEPSQYPTAKFAFDLFSRHVKLWQHSWTACVGLMGDNQLEQWREFAEGAASEINSSIDEFWKINEIISAVETLAPAKLQKLMLLMAASSHPSQIINSGFSSYVAKLNSQLDKLLRQFKKERKVFDSQGLVWFEFKAKSNIKSALINKVSNDYFPDKTVIVVQDKGGRHLYFSARRQDFRVKTNDLLENAVKGLEGAGAGGHVPASAGRIRKRDLKEFRKRIMAELSSP